MIIIIDAGLGNLRNVEKAFEKLGHPAKISSDGTEIKNASALVFPGVGHFGQAMKNLKKAGLAKIIKEKIAQGTPFLGICLGMQLLFEKSEEAPGMTGLAVLKGTVKKFPKKIAANGKLKIPQIGWNNLKLSKPVDKIFAGLKDNEMFYFVHSYFAKPFDKKTITGQTDYGLIFTSAVTKNNLRGVQFHPEKSGLVGLKILNNFAKICASKASKKEKEGDRS